MLCLPGLVAAHPLDPLTPDEIRAAAQVARTDARFATAQFASILLDEPAKADVIAWRPGTTLPRPARLVVMTTASVFEVVDRSDRPAHRLGGRAQRRRTARHAVRVRGGEDRPDPSGIPRGAGEARRDRSREALLLTDHRRLLRHPGACRQTHHQGGCYDLRRTTTNMWGWPIERLYAVVDLRERKVLSVADAGVVPIADREQNFTEAAAGTLREARKPTVMAQPQGANVVINGNEISWGNWRFHARVDGRVGTVISVARWQDGAGCVPCSIRATCQRCSCRTWMPTTAGTRAPTSTPASTAPARWRRRSKPASTARRRPHFLPTTFGDDKGEPITTPNALCIFERGTGDPIWRHAEPLNQTYEGRANVELVVRMAAAVGNYDYLFDWVFNDAAEIEVRVGATGIDALKGVNTRSMADPTAAGIRATARWSRRTWSR